MLAGGGHGKYEGKAGITEIGEGSRLGLRARLLTYVLSSYRAEEQRGGQRMAERVLVVDDHPPMVGLIQDALTREGFVVRTAHDGTSGLRAVAAEQPDLIILDVVMPGMDGFEVLRRLREQPGTKDIPVIILTVRRDQGDLLTGYMAGASLYVNKPCEMRDLVAAVKRLLGTAARI